MQKEIYSTIISGPFYIHSISSHKPPKSTQHLSIKSHNRTCETVHIWYRRNNSSTVGVDHGPGRNCVQIDEVDPAAALDGQDRVLACRPRDTLLTIVLKERVESRTITDDISGLDYADCPGLAAGGRRASGVGGIIVCSVNGVGNDRRGIGLEVSIEGNVRTCNGGVYGRGLTGSRFESWP